MYPSRPDFTSAEPMSAWWTVHTADGVRLCSSTGRAAVRQAQAVLREELSQTIGTRVRNNGAADLDTLSALSVWIEGWSDDDLTWADDWDAFFGDDEARDAALATVRADLAARRLSRETLRILLWVGHAMLDRVPLERFRIREDAVVPPVGDANSDDLNEAEPLCVPLTGPVAPPEPAPPTPPGPVTPRTPPPQGAAPAWRAPALALGAGAALGALLHLARRALT
jgi:hypothetical protein